MNNEEKLLTILFAEVSGSVRLHEKLGNAEALRAVDRCLKRMERGVEGFGGRVVKTVGGELMSVFDLPDDAAQAAIEMQQRVADLPPVSGVKLAIRAGFSYGPVSGKEGEFIGEAVDMAAHLTGLAGSGQVLTCTKALGELSPAIKAWARELSLATSEGNTPEFEVFEVVMPEIAAPVAKGKEAPPKEKSDGTQNIRLRLRYNGEVVILDARNTSIKMGRGVKSDVSIRDRRASRDHAEIVRRGDVFVLSDTSTNGTYLTLAGEKELLLRGTECAIYGKGLICFAASAASPKADCAEFEQI